MLQVVTRIKKVCLFPANTTLGWRVIRMVTVEQGEMHEARANWRRVYDSITGELIGFQLIAPEASRYDKDLPSMPSSASISKSEMQINAESTSLTAGLAEDMRLELKVPEDHTERVQAKVRVWPHVGAKKGDVLVAWPK